MAGLAPKGNDASERIAGHILAGVAGGTAFLLLGCMAAVRAGASFWIPMNAIAAVLFPDMRPLSMAFDLQAVSTGLVIHLYVSAFWGLVYGLVLDQVLPDEARRGAPVFLWGAGFGVILWLVMGWWVGPAFIPEVSRAPQFQSLIAHAVFGLVTAKVDLILAEQRLVRATARSRKSPAGRKRPPPRRPSRK